MGSLHCRCLILPFSRSLRLSGAATGVIGELPCCKELGWALLEVQHAFKDLVGTPL
jgi:hypothetical protein